MLKDKSAAFTELYYSRPMYVNQQHVLFLLMLQSELDRSSSSDDAKSFWQLKDFC